MNNSDVSVIIPIYNTEEYLDECLKSIENLASKVSAEVLLIDDGSTDGSAEIAKKYVERNEAFQYHFKNNSGVSASRNYGIDHACGKYLIFVDADDYIVPDVYKEMLEIAKKHNSDIVRCNFDRLKYGSVKASLLAKRAAYGLNTALTNIAECDSLVYDTIGCNKLIKRSLFNDNNIRYPEGIIYNEDEPVVARLNYYANHCATCFKTGYLWRIRTGETKSVTQDNADSTILHHKLAMMEDTIRFYKKQGFKQSIIDRLTWKSLVVNLPIFIQMLEDVPKEETNEWIKSINEFVDSCINPEVEKRMPAIVKQAVTLLKRGDTEQLFLLSNFWKDGYGNIPLDYDSGDEVKMHLPEKLFDTSDGIAANDYIDNPPSVSVNNCVIEGGLVKLEGHIFQKRVQTSSDYPQTVEAFLIDSMTDRRIDLKTTVRRTEYLTKERGIVICHEDNLAYRYNHDLGGFSIEIDAAGIDEMNDIEGDMALLIHHKNVLSEGTQSVRGVTADVKKQLKTWKYVGQNSAVSIVYDRSGNVFVRRTPKKETASKDDKLGTSEKKAKLNENKNADSVKNKSNKKKKKKELIKIPVTSRYYISLIKRLK